MLAPTCLRFLRIALWLGLLCLLLAPLARAAKPTVLVLGDSISAAYGMSLEQGWVSLLETRLREEEPTLEVVNASISGETSAGGLRRLPALLAEHQPRLLIIELGGNDGLRGYPISKLRDNLSAMVRLASQAGTQTLILPMEIPPNYGNRYTAMFRNAFIEVAQQDGAVLGPFLLDGIATQTVLMQSDGIHPRAEAQPQMLNTVYLTIRELL